MGKLVRRKFTPLSKQLKCWAPAASHASTQELHEVQPVGPPEGLEASKVCAQRGGSG